MYDAGKARLCEGAMVHVAGEVGFLRHRIDDIACGRVHKVDVIKANGSGLTL